MTDDKLEELQLELKSSLNSIDILTDKLINLAVIENKFISLVEQLRHQEIKCAGILFNVELAEKRVECKARELSDYFTFRFKWMERFFTKRRFYR